MRVAVYYAPDARHPLSAAAARWLGRDASTDRPIPQAPVAGLTPGELEAVTAGPRRYGFHATLKAPFRLACGPRLEDLEAALADFASALMPVTVPALAIRRLDGFFALVPEPPVAALDALAAEVVRRFDGFRAPPTEDETARRRPASLSASQHANLMRWGYPYVFGDFRFHMTLTSELPPPLWERTEAALRAHFVDALQGPTIVDSLSLFVERSPPGDFVVHSTAQMAGASKRWIAHD